jgi:ribosome-binding protein aMBF1 (putative translation factor)
MSERRRVFRKAERTPEELAELRAEREHFSRERPGPEDLIASGDYDGPYRQGDLMALLSALAAIKQERERRGLSLADVSERSGLDKAMLSRLENGKILNPTVATLWRYAEAVGMALRLSAERVPAGAGG